MNNIMVLTLFFRIYSPSCKFYTTCIILYSPRLVVWSVNTFWLIPNLVWFFVSLVSNITKVDMTRLCTKRKDKPLYSHQRSFSISFFGRNSNSSKNQHSYLMKMWRDRPTTDLMLRLSSEFSQRYVILFPTHSDSQRLAWKSLASN